MTRTRLYQAALFLSLALLLYLTVRSCKSPEEKRVEKPAAEAIREVLNDSLRTYVNRYGELEQSKSVIQAELSAVRRQNRIMNENQKKLFEEIRKQNREKTVIAAALVEMQTTVTNLRNDQATVKDSVAYFADQDSDFRYFMRVSRLYSKTPVLHIDSVSMPNTQFISFDWGTRKEGHPVSFTIRNSNRYMQALDVQAYAIPSIIKSDLKPNLWQRATRKRFLVGIGPGIGYNPLTGSFSMSIQAGIYYRLFTL